MEIIMRKSKRERMPAQNTQRHRMTAQQRHEEINRDLAEKRKNLYRKNGMSKDGNSRFVASIPAEVVREVQRNDGADAVKDTAYLIRRAEALGHPVRMGQSKRRR